MRTIGGQIVGREPLFCEPKGASDYCMHCTEEMITRHPCSVLEAMRLKAIPDDDVAAFGCWVESVNPSEGIRCEKWCHRAICAYALRDIATLP